MRFSILLSAAIAAIGAKAASAVIDLIPDNFDSVVLKSGKPALVEFFAPWCGHCKTLAPIYEELASSFQHAEKKLVIAKVDADAHKSLGQKFGVQGFPTLKWFDGKSDKPEDYNGGRDIDSLSSFITSKTGIKIKNSKASSHVEILNDVKFNQTIGKEKNVLVAFTAPWCGHCKTLAPIYEELAADFANEETVVIAKVDAESADSRKVAAEQKIQGFPTLKWFAAGSKEPSPYEGARTEQALIDFVNKEAGTYRAVGGSLTAAGGTIAAVDTIIQSIFAAGGDVATKADEIVKAAKGEKGTYAEYYAKAANKIKGNNKYLDKEIARLEGILSKGGLAPKKTDDLTSRANILRKFKNAVGIEDKSEL